MKNIGKVFRFTLLRQFETKSYRNLLIIVAVILFLLPAVLIPLITKASADDIPITDENDTAVLERVYFVSELTSPLPAEQLTSQPPELFRNTEFILCADREEAFRRAGEDSLILLLREEEEMIEIFSLLPENCRYGRNMANLLSNAMWDRLYELKLTALDASQLAALMTDWELVPGTILPEDPAEDDPGMQEMTEEEMLLEDVRGVLGYVLPFGSVMLIYFMVLFYGQSVANTVVLEKTSKLMDQFLVTVKPREMVFGKIGAGVTAALLQVICWLAGLVAGFAVGILLASELTPGEELGIITVLLLVKDILLASAFAKILLFVLFLIGGFVLYCSLAAIGGAIASKPEELATTNSYFTLVLVVSYMAALFSGVLGTMHEPISYGLLDIIPFTSILITPSRVLLGEVALWQGLLSLILVLVTAMLLLILAGKVYKMMSLYKGELLKPWQVIRKVFSKQ